MCFLRNAGLRRCRLFMIIWVFCIVTIMLVWVLSYRYLLLLAIYWSRYHVDMVHMCAMWFVSSFDVGSLFVCASYGRMVWFRFLWCNGQPIRCPLLVVSLLFILPVDTALSTLHYSNGGNRWGNGECVSLLIKSSPFPLCLSHSRSVNLAPYFPHRYALRLRFLCFRGTVEYCEVAGKVDIINSTLGKALGGTAGNSVCLMFGTWPSPWLLPVLYCYDGCLCGCRVVMVLERHQNQWGFGDRLGDLVCLKYLSPEKLFLTMTVVRSLWNWSPLLLDEVLV